MWLLFAPLIALCVLVILALAVAGFEWLWIETRGAGLMFKIPPMKWLTLDEVVAMGYSASMCRLLLDAMHERKIIEVRKRAGLSEVEELVASVGYSCFNASCFEVRKIARLHRKRERLREVLHLFTPVWQIA